jgi:hypothetical protein
MRNMLVSVLLLMSAPSIATAGQLVHAPGSDRRTEVTELGYIDAHDDVQGKDYACVIYKEQDRRSGEWELKVKLKGGVSRTTSIKPDTSSFRRRMSDAAAEGMKYFLWGYHMDPSEDDARRIENRIYFSDTGKPQYLQVHLVTRNRDGSAKEAKVARVKWPATEQGRRLSLPDSDRSTAIKELAYLDSYDVAAARHYAYLAYKETDTDSGKWVVKIDGNVTASTTIDPDSGPLRRKIRDAARAGRKYVVWGFQIQPREDDPRLVETRVYFGKTLRPTAVEIHLVTRQADGGAGKEQVARFDWPA